jgi:hypothetical protein
MLNPQIKISARAILSDLHEFSISEESHRLCRDGNREAFGALRVLIPLANSENNSPGPNDHDKNREAFGAL